MDSKTTSVALTSLAYDASAPGSLLYILQHLPSSSSSQRDLPAASSKGPQPKVPSHLKGDQKAKAPNDNDKEKKKKKKDDNPPPPPPSAGGGKVTITSSVSGVIKMQDKAMVQGKANFTLDLGGKVVLQGAGLDFEDCSDFEVTRVVVDVGSASVQKNKLNGASIDCLTFNNCQRAYVHHNELFHSTDETVNVGRGSDQVNFCNNVIALPMNNPALHNGELHGYAAVMTSVAPQAQNAMHHNFIVSCLSRMPRFDGAGLVDFSNNVVVNPGKVVGYDGPDSSATMNFYNNVVLTGPNSVDGLDLIKLNSSKSRVYLANNTMDGSPSSSVNLSQAKASSSTLLLASKASASWASPLAQQQTQLQPSNVKSWAQANLPQMTDLSQNLIKWLQQANLSAKASLPQQFDIQSTWVPVKLVAGSS